MPVTMPLLLPTEATEISLLLQVPEAVALLNAAVEPAQTANAPVIDDGVANTVSALVVMQPVAIV